MNLPTRADNQLIPPDEVALGEARRLCQDAGLNVTDLAACVSQDPILVITVLRKANNVELATSRSPLSLNSAIMRLGSAPLKSAFHELENINQPTSKRAQKWLNFHRQRCRRTGMVARILANEIARDIEELCHTCGLFMYLGEMYAVVALGSIYTDLVESQNLARAHYRITADYGFDTEKERIEYLLRLGVPQNLCDVLNKEATPSEVVHRPVRPIIYTASELVEAYDSNNQHQYLLLDEIPKQSSFRLLQIQERQYNRVLRKILAYLDSDKELRTALEPAASDETPKPQSETQIQTPKFSVAIPPKTNPVSPPDPEKLRLDKLRKLVEKSSPNEAEFSNTQEARTETKVSLDPLLLFSPEERDLIQKFDLLDTTNTRQLNRANRVLITDPAELANNAPIKSKEKIRNIEEVIQKAQSSEQLLMLSLNLLVQYGFVNAALVACSKDKTQGLILACRGPDLTNGNVFLLDASSPISGGFSKIQSKGMRTERGPLNSSTYAVAPLSIDHSTPISIYADCGKDVVISFDARRTFRHLVAQTNNNLPALTGGLLIEVPGLC